VARGVSDRDAPSPGAPRRLGAFRRAVRRMAVDVRPLRTSRDFALLWWGEIVSQTGTQITIVALFVQVFALTHSPVAVGAVGLVQLVPMIIVSLLFGPVIDRVDRRRILIFAQIGQAGGSSLLLLSALMHHPPLGLIYLAAAINAALVSVALPTRAAATPNLVPPEMLPAATALNQVMWNTAAVVGPALGGVIVARFGLQWAYGIDVASYGVALVAAFLLHPLIPKRDHYNEEERGADAVLALFRYLKGRRVLQSTFTVDIVAMVFGMPRALFPALALHQFGRGPEVVGWLFAAPAAGALIAALSSGWVGRVNHMGRAILIAVTVWGAAIAGFGLSGDRLGIALVMLAIAGGADVISAVFRSTMQQLVVPDSLRGRLSSFNILVVAGGPRLGDFEAGVVAQAFTPMVSVVSGGLLCIAGVAAIGAAVPGFARWKVGDSA
jgi:MFS family permease